MSETHEPGAAIRAALEARGCALEAHEGRALAESLIALICSGLIVAECAGTAPAYNMGQSKYMERGDRE
ncbi:MAG: hypothetical protein ACYCXR_08010 [Coriobacteriia bacterium]